MNFEEATQAIVKLLGETWDEAIDDVESEDLPLLNLLAEDALRYGQKAAAGDPEAIHNLKHLEAQAAAIVARAVVRGGQRLEAKLFEVARIAGLALGYALQIAMRAMLPNGGGTNPMA